MCSLYNRLAEYRSHDYCINRTKCRAWLTNTSSAGEYGKFETTSIFIRGTRW